MKCNVFRQYLKPITVLLCTAIALTLFPVRPSDAAGTSSEIQAIEARLRQLEQSQKEYEDKISSLNQSAAGALETKASYEEQIQVIEQKITSTNDLISQYETLIEQTITDIDGKEDQIDDKFDEFLERLRVNYEDGFVNYLVLVLESGSFTEFLMNTERTADILEYDRSLMNSLEEEKGTLEDTKTQLEAARAAQQEAKRALENDRASLNAKRAELEEFIQSLNSDAARYEQLLEEAQKANDELNAKLEAALAALAAKEVKQHPVAQGAMIWPVSTAYSTVSSPFGGRTLNGRYDFHYGVDIPAPAGSNVYASQAGVVEYAEWHYSYGNYIVINHGGGYTTLYAHNTSLAVSVGDTVEQGQVIAYVGQTGSAYGDHCHFEVRYYGQVQNPMNYLTQP